MTTLPANPPKIPTGNLNEGSTVRHNIPVPFPRVLRISLAAQMTVTGLIVVGSLLLGLRAIPLMGLLIMLAWFGVSKLLAIRSYGIWIGTRRCALVGLLVLGLVTACAAMQSLVHGILGTLIWLLQLYYLAALNSAEARRFYLGDQPSDESTSRSQAKCLPRSIGIAAAAILLGGMASLDAVASGLKIRTVSYPKGAVIAVNGKRARRETPSTVSANAGDIITLHYPGYEVFKTKATGKTSKIDVRLKEITKFTMFVEAKTFDQKNAGTDDLKVVLRLNGDEQQERSLNNKGDDRRVGARDKYELTFDCPAAKLKGIRIAAIAGDDAWKCEYVAVRMVKEDNSSSKTYLFKVNAWLSADAKEGKRFYDAKFNSLRFRR